LVKIGWFWGKYSDTIKANQGRKQTYKENQVFTGIVQAIGKVESMRAGSGGTRRLTIKTDLDVARMPIGSSMAVNGACLTLVECRKGHPSSFQADLGRETLACTTLGKLAVGTQVHLEPALRLSDMLGGHLVSGHVDGIGKVEVARRQGDMFDLKILAPESIAPYLFMKGSIAINGVSLTINHVSGETLDVLLIPHTLSVTLLGELRPGDDVNLEADILAKHIARYVETFHAK
jgi:riboflavin synthase